MLAIRLHALCRNRPDPGIKIKLAPPCPTDFAGSGRGQDRKLERARRDSLVGTQLSNEFADLPIGQRGVMRHFLNLPGRRK